MGKEQKTIPILDLALEGLEEEKYLVNLGQFEIFFENGETYFVKKKPTYPKTYAECCTVLEILPILSCNDLWICERYQSTKEMHEHFSARERMSIRHIAFLKLLVCRDAYWKIVGVQMGLGKPWEPDWTSPIEQKSVIHTIHDKIYLDEVVHRNHILAFPEKTLCEDFYNNFKDLIEECKEFL